MMLLDATLPAMKIIYYKHATNDDLLILQHLGNANIFLGNELRAVLLVFLFRCDGSKVPGRF